ncbi:ATP-binding cassette domain-containing protein [Ruthenibacterium lactatiformans]|nr:ATP-binding cassette domain-containing protein [Ruthenibacterium lactatiformans]
MAWPSSFTSARDGPLRGLLGPNGAGKSTMMNIITGVWMPPQRKVL